jgi:hypothetical protein
MIAKVLGDRTRSEPWVWVINREFEEKDRSLEASLSAAPSEAQALLTATNGRPPVALLVTSEIHSGEVFKKAAAHLRALNIEPKTFALIGSRTSNFRVDYYMVCSDKRGLLPWEDSPSRPVA